MNYCQEELGLQLQPKIIQIDGDLCTQWQVSGECDDTVYARMHVCCSDEEKVYQLKDNTTLALFTKIFTNMVRAREIQMDNALVNEEESSYFG